MITKFYKQRRFLDGIFEYMIPKGHRMRRLFEALDFSFVDEICAKYYKNRDTGRPAESPERIIRMFFLLFHEGIPGETRLVERVKTDVAYRFFCRFHIDDKIPDHSTLWAFRKRLGPEGFQEIFEKILLQCLEQGLVKGDRFMFDCTDIKAKGTPYSKHQQAFILAKALLESLEEKDGDDDSKYSPRLLKLVSRIASEASGYRRPESIEKKMAEELKAESKEISTPSSPEDNAANPCSDNDCDNNPIDGTDPDDDPPGGGKPPKLPDEEKLKAAAEELRKTLPHTAGDTDARTGHTSSHKTFTGHMVGISTNDFRQVVTSVELFPGNVVQSGTVLKAMEYYRRKIAPLLESSDNDGEKPGKLPRLVMDSAFDYPEVYETAELCGLNPIISLRKRPSKKKRYDSDRFEMDEDGQLRCPAGHIMTRPREADDYGRYEYRGGKLCKNCPLRAECTTAKNGRTVTLNPGSKLQRQVQLEKARSDAYKKDLRERMIIEGVFGDGKSRRNLGRALYRSALMVKIQLLAWASVHNLMKLFRYGCRGASASSGKPSPPTSSACDLPLAA